MCNNKEKVEYPTFTREEFDSILQVLKVNEDAVYQNKRSEYSPDEDVLENFHTQATLQGTTPAQIALTFFLKHILSIAISVRSKKYLESMTFQNEDGSEGLMQKFIDARNYIPLMIACMESERKAENQNNQIS